MYKLFIKSLFLLSLIVCTSLSAQKSAITFEEVTGEACQTEGLSALQSLNNGKEYSVQNYNSLENVFTIAVYDYVIDDKVKTLTSK